MRGLATTISLWAAVLLGGCSALGLTDGLDQAQGCGDCAELNALEPPPDCMSWECSDLENPTLGRCVIDLLDADDDGAPDMRCAIDERPPDCDDDDDRVSPTLPEVCDGRDNDCDGLVDEELDYSEEVLAEGRFDGVSWARGEAGVAGAYFDRQTLLHIVDGSGDRMVSNQMRPNPSSVLGAAGADFAVGVIQSVCPSYVTGAWGTDDAMVAVDATHAMDGVPSSIACAGASTWVESAAIVGRGPTVFVTAFVHGDGATDACGEMVGGSALVAALRRDPGGAPTPAGDATRAGVHAGIGEPALLDLGDLGVLLALVGTSSIELHRLTLQFTDPAPVRAALALEIPCEGTCGHLSLAALPGQPGVVGVAYRDGTCAAPEVRFVRVRVEAGSVTAMDPSPLNLGAGDIRRVSVAARAASPSWLVAWADGQRLRGQRLAAEPVGEPLEFLRSAGFFVEPLLVDYDDARATVYAYDANAERLVAQSAACPAE